MCIKVGHFCQESRKFVRICVHCVQGRVRCIWSWIDYVWGWVNYFTDQVNYVWSNVKWFDNCDIAFVCGWVSCVQTRIKCEGFTVIMLETESLYFYVRVMCVWEWVSWTLGQVSCDWCSNTSYWVSCQSPATKSSLTTLWTNREGLVLLERVHFGCLYCCLFIRPSVCHLTFLIFLAYWMHIRIYLSKR